MKASSSSGWMHRGNRDKPHALDTADLNMPNLHHPPTTPTYTTPRFAPEPPVSKGFKLANVFGRRAASPAPGSSFPSSATPLPASTASLQSGNHHPYGSMGPSPVPVVSTPDAPEDEDECPVCLEPLSFSFRLPGEKPHIVPECGHSLHEASTLTISHSAITL